MSSELTISPIDIRNASDSEYAAMNVFMNKMRSERMPDDPPIPLEESIANCHNIPEKVDVYVWLVREPGSDKIIGSGDVGIAHFDSNLHIANTSIGIDPDFRRRGIARRLLHEVARTAQQAGRSLIMAGTSGNIPAGEAFLEAIGARRGLESHLNQLKIDELNREMLTEWLSPSAGTASEFTLTVEQGPYRESDLEAITALFNESFNSMPRGELQMEDYRFTPEHLRQFEQSTFIGGRERWTAFVRHRETNAFAGFTEVSWHPNRPMILGQSGTAVLPPFRHKGLGRWLKASMLDRVLSAHPEIKFVRTDNANVNAAMLEINNALGFKPYHSETSWQIETDKVFEYLGSTASS